MKPLTKLFAEDIIKKLRNKYSSLLFRDLIQAHCGVLIASEKTPDGMPEIECRVKELSKSNRKQFGEICAAILGAVLKYRLNSNFTLTETRSYFSPVSK